MNKRKLASLQIWNEDFYVSPVLSFMDTLTSRHGKISLSRYNQMRFVVGEVLKRRIETAFPGGKGEMYVEFYLTKSFFEISVRDKGVPGWMDFSYDRENIGKDKKTTENFVLDLFVDQIGMEKLGSNGQRIFIRKNIINPIEFEAPEPYPEIEVLDTNISIRPVVTEEDVIEAIRCIYSEYGYSYSYERLYYVESFMNMLKTKELISYLLVNDHGQIAGHFALAFSELYKNMPEAATLVIRKEFRGLGLVAMVIEQCEKVARENGVRALMVQPVTFHPMSQKAVLKAGYTATSFLMSYMADSIESEYNKNGERLGLGVCVKILDENAHSEIYPPKEIEAFIKKTYDRLGLRYTIAGASGQTEETVVTTEINKPLEMMRIILQSAGEDIEGVLRSSIKEAIRSKSQMIELAILLNTPSCEKAYEAGKKCEFMLSGVIPGGENGDYLIMQMLPGAKLHYDNIVTVGQFDELRDDIIEINKGV